MRRTRSDITLAVTLISALLTVATPSAFADDALSIQQFGATPDDLSDDVVAIQAAIDTAAANQTIRFPKGLYRIGRSLSLRSHQTYRGEDGAILQAIERSSPFLMVVDGQTDVAIEGLRLDGGGLWLRGYSWDIRIEGNIFQNIYRPNSDFGEESGIFVSDRADAVTIRNNSFVDVGYATDRKKANGSNAILAYDLSNAEIVNNQFERVFQGISLIFEGEGASGSGIHVAGNVVRDPLRVGIEAMGTGVLDALFENNKVEMSAHRIEDLGISIVITGGFRTVVRNNVLINTTPYSEPCTKMGLEVAGIGTLVLNNRIAGHWCSGIDIYSTEVQYSNVVDNFICGHRSSYEPISFYAGKYASTASGNRIEKDCPPELSALPREHHGDQAQANAPNGANAACPDWRDC